MAQDSLAQDKGAPRSPQRLERIAAPLRKQMEMLISEAIAVGEFKPGERLIERDLCERYEVSRTVIREALRHLEAQGLIEMVANRGPVVATVSAEEAVSLYEVRASLEALAARSFALRATPEDRKRIQAAIAGVQRHIYTADMVEQLTSKDQFYDALFEGAHNRTIGSLLRTLHARIRMLRSLSLGAPGRAEDTLAELQAIVDAMLDGDAENAARLAKQHVDNACAVVLRQLSGLPDEHGPEAGPPVTTATGARKTRRAPRLPASPRAGWPAFPPPGSRSPPRAPRPPLRDRPG
jgi:DNA-binding GntR family transcriptional regulator